jgi:hypothetical protein
MADPNAAQSKPKLVAVGPDGNAPNSGNSAPSDAVEEERSGISRGLFWLVVALLVVAGLALAVQGQRVAEKNAEIAALSSQVEGLQVDLSAANARLQTFQSQLVRIRAGVSELLEKTAALHELVSNDPLAVPAREAPPTP